MEKSVSQGPGHRRDVVSLESRKKKVATTNLKQNIITAILGDGVTNDILHRVNKTNLLAVRAEGC